MPKDYILSISRDQGGKVTILFLPICTVILDYNIDILIILDCYYTAVSIYIKEINDQMVEVIGTSGEYEAT